MSRKSSIIKGGTIVLTCSSNFKDLKSVGDLDSGRKSSAMLSKINSILLTFETTFA